MSGPDPFDRMLEISVGTGELLMEAVSRKTEVADAAQWLFLNRTTVGSDFLAITEPEKILRVCEIAKRWDAAPCPLEEKKYSLSDLCRAYDEGFCAAGMSQFDSEDYKSQRHEALREFK